MYTLGIIKWLFPAKFLEGFRNCWIIWHSKSQKFLSFYLVVVHLLSSPHLLLTFSYQTLLTDHSIVLTEVHGATGCPDGAKDQNWPKRLNSFTILGWDFVYFSFPFCWWHAISLSHCWVGVNRFHFASTLLAVWWEWTLWRLWGLLGCGNRLFTRWNWGTLERFISS